MEGEVLFRPVPFLRTEVCPFHLHCLAEAIEWAARQEGVTHTHHYLDDFFVTGAPGSNECGNHLYTLTSLCNHLRVFLAEEKVEGPTTCLEYLGILLDSIALEAWLPPDKLDDIHQALHRWSTQTECRKQELLSLIGTLRFAAKVVPAGQSFLRRMIDTSTTARNPQETISLPETFKLDLAWWKAFATQWNAGPFSS